MTNASASSPHDAVDVLREVETIQRQTRSLLQAFWFPLVVFGAITLASSPIQWFWTGSAVGLFWLVAAPLGCVAVGRYYHQRELRLGLTRPATPYLLTAVGIFAGAFVLPIVTHGDLQEVVSAFAVAAGYLAFAWLERSRSLVLLAVVLAGVPATVLAVGAAHPGAITAAGTGAAILVSGLISRRAA